MPRILLPAEQNSLLPDGQDVDAYYDHQTLNLLHDSALLELQASLPPLLKPPSVT